MWDAGISSIGFPRCAMTLAHLFTLSAKLLEFLLCAIVLGILNTADTDICSGVYLPWTPSLFILDQEAALT